MWIKRLILFVLIVSNLPALGKPMEPAKKTLFILVHGTMDASRGYEENNCTLNNIASWNRASLDQMGTGTIF